MKSFNLGLEYFDDNSSVLIVTAFDPGVTTGWAVLRVPAVRLLEEGFKSTVRDDRFSWNSGDIFTEGRDLNASVDKMVDVVRAAYSLGAYPDDVFLIAMENFQLRLLDSSWSLLAPVRVFEKFEYWMHTSNLRWAYVKENSSDAMNVVTDARLAAWGMYRKGSPHQRDALRHAILAARKWASDPKYRQLVGQSQPML